ncbi:MAG: hypothetical protein ABIQ95_04765, partial [Bdellovibrionia bacterium]
MNGAQLHLLLNHIPLFLPLFGGSALGLGLILKSSDVKKFGLCLLFASALAAIPAYLTGVPAERVVKNYPGILRAAIEAHQAAALISLIL